MRPPLVVSALVAVLVVAPAVATPAVAATPTMPRQSTPDDADVGTTLFRGQSSVWANLDTASAVRNARFDGRLYQGTIAVPGETVVLQFQSERLNDSVVRADGTNTTDRFFAALDATNATARVVQLNPSPERQALRVDLRESDVRVVRDPATATFWLALDTTDPTLTRADGDPLPDRTLDPGIELRFEITAPNDEEFPTYSARVRFVEFEPAHTSLTGDVTSGVPLYAQPNGSLDLYAVTPTLPGEQVTVRVRTENGTVLDSVTTTAEPIENRLQTRLDALLSLDALDPDEEFVVEVVARNRTLFERRGLVGEPPVLSDETAHRFANGTTRFTATVRYPDGGFLTVRAEDDDRPLATVYVPADESRQVDVVASGVSLREELYVVGWWDVNDDGQFAPGGEPRDEPWQVAGSLAETSVRVEPATPTATATVHSLGSPTATVPAPGTTSTTTRAQPGFGAVAALLAVAGLPFAVRRCD